MTQPLAEGLNDVGASVCPLQHQTWRFLEDQRGVRSAPGTQRKRPPWDFAPQFFCLTYGWQRGSFLPVVRPYVSGLPHGVSHPENRHVLLGSDRHSTLRDRNPA
jgi:hypothetical protein